MSEEELNKKWLKDELKEFSYSNKFFEKILDLLSKQYINGLKQSRFEKNVLEQENQELKKQLKIIQDGFTSSINDLCEYAIENERLKKQLSNSHQIKMKRLQQENKKLKQQLSNSHQIKNQQKEFIEWLEKLVYQNMVASDFANGCKVAYGIALNRYKEIMRCSND